MHPLCDQDCGPSQTNLDALLSLPEKISGHLYYSSSMYLQIFVGLLISFQISVSQVPSNASALIHINGLKGMYVEDVDIDKDSCGDQVLHVVLPPPAAGVDHVLALPLELLLQQHVQPPLLSPGYPGRSLLPSQHALTKLTDSLYNYAKNVNLLTVKV